MVCQMSCGAMTTAETLAHLLGLKRNMKKIYEPGRLGGKKAKDSALQEAI